MTGSTSAILRGALLLMSMAVLAALFFTWPVLSHHVSYSPWRDFAIWIVSFLIVIRVAWWLSDSGLHPFDWFDPNEAPMVVGLFAMAGPMLVGLLLLSWGGSTVADGILEGRTLDHSPERFQKIRRPEWKEARVGLALSGGGYRAAVMHAGVLHALDQLHEERSGVPVTHLSSVSGGSIIAAFYAAGGKPQDFMHAVRDGRFHLKRDLINMHNALRLPFPMRVPFTELRLLPFYDFSRTDVQANLLDRVLLGGLSMGELRAKGGPELMICTTDMTWGHAVGITSHGVLRRPIASFEAGRTTSSLSLVSRSPSFHASSDVFPGDTRVACLVAASGAFPGAFAPMQFEMQGRPLTLADGGIIDNLGVGLLIDHHQYWCEQDEETPGNEVSWGLNLLLISDAGKSFEAETGSGVLHSVNRTVEIIHATSALSTADRVAEGLPLIRFSPGQLPNKERIEDLQEVSRERVRSLKGRFNGDEDLALERIVRCREVFYRTSTLHDRLGEDAEALFELGQLLVWWYLPEIEEELNAASTGGS